MLANIDPLACIRGGTAWIRQILCMEGVRRGPTAEDVFSGMFSGRGVPRARSMPWLPPPPYPPPPAPKLAVRSPPSTDYEQVHAQLHQEQVHAQLLNPPFPLLAPPSPAPYVQLPLLHMYSQGAPPQNEAGGTVTKLLSSPPRPAGCTIPSTVLPSSEYAYSAHVQSVLQTPVLELLSAAKCRVKARVQSKAHQLAHFGVVLGEGNVQSVKLTPLLFSLGLSMLMLFWVCAVAWRARYARARRMQI